VVDSLVLPQIFNAHHHSGQAVVQQYLSDEVVASRRNLREETSVWKKYLGTTIKKMEEPTAFVVVPLNDVYAIDVVQPENKIPTRLSVHPLVKIVCACFIVLVCFYAYGLLK